MGRACPVGTACNRIHILQPDPCAHGPTSCIRKEGVTLRTAPAAGPNPPGVFARCGNVYTFLATGRPNATGIAGSRTDRRRAVPARIGGPRGREPGNREPQRRGARRDGGGQGRHARAAHRTGARRPPAGPQNFWLRQKFNCATFAKVAKAPMFVYSAARKGKRMERLSLKQRERYGSIHVSFRWRG